MSVFFLADTHFGDGNILRYENRPFATVEEMDRELIRRWNAVSYTHLTLPTTPYV